jgi:hypothetical protein
MFIGMRYVLVIHRRDLLIKIFELFIRAHDQDSGGLSCFRVPPVFYFTRGLFIGMRYLLVIRGVRRGIHWSSSSSPTRPQHLLSDKGSSLRKFKKHRGWVQLT